MTSKIKLNQEDFKKYEDLFEKIRNEMHTAQDVPNLLKGIPDFENIKSQKPEQVKAFIVGSLLYLGEYMSDESQNENAIFSILSVLLRKNLNYTENEWIELMTLIHQAVLKINPRIPDSFWHLHYVRFPMNSIVKQLENYLKTNKPTEHLKSVISEILNWENLEVTNRFERKNMPQIIQRLLTISQTSEENSSKNIITETIELPQYNGVKQNMRIFLANYSAEKPVFWDLEVSGDILYEHPNKKEEDGDNGQIETEFKTVKEARKEAEQLINKRLEEGYTVRLIQTLSNKRFKEMDKFIKTIVKKYDGKLKGIPLYEDLKQQNSDYLKAFFIDLLLYMNTSERYRVEYWQTEVSEALMRWLLTKNLNHTESELILFLKHFHASTLDYYSCVYPSEINLAKQIERCIKKNGLSERLKVVIQEIVGWKYLDTPKKFKALLTEKSNTEKTENQQFYFQLKDDKFGEQVNKIIEESTLHDKQEFQNVLVLANAVSNWKPTKKFLKETDEKINSIGKENYKEVAHTILEVVAKGKSVEQCYELYRSGAKHFFTGIVLTMTSFSDKKTVGLLTDIIEKAYKKAVAISLGNACVYILGNMQGKNGLGALSCVRQKVKQSTRQKLIDKYLTEGAKKYNVSTQELQEMSVPDFNLINGEKTVDFADYKFNISISGSKVIQQWIKPDGKTMKSVPSVVKNDTKLNEKLKEVRQDIKEIQKICLATKQRFDNQFILEQTWDFKSFDAYYLSHGLVCSIAKSLIFNLQKGRKKASAIFYNGKWETATGEVLTWVDETSSVKLWHPVFATENEIVAWRDFIINNEIKQALKQAYREIYILTDAEIKTETYSNRMASHILKQHQFKALAEIRDWKFTQHGYIDNGAGDADKYLEKYKITANYAIDGVPDENAGLFMQYVQSGELTFYKGNRKMKLANVPKIVFSEIMRDTDLFVGVCSVGNDPQWQDNTYWQNRSFGSLTEIAKTRKAVLERLLPRLTKLNKKAHLDGKFLVVKGDLRTYKIHIGSSNILMEPNDQYLCIVPTVNPSTDKLFIPFDGDRGLSIVLSKAFLLAEDSKIKDTTITSQINRE